MFVEELQARSFQFEGLVVICVFGKGSVDGLKQKKDALSYKLSREFIMSIQSSVPMKARKTFGTQMLKEFGKIQLIIHRWCCLEKLVTIT